MDQEDKVITCVHGRKIKWKDARVIVNNLVPPKVMEQLQEGKLDKNVCLYDLLLGKEKA